MSESPYRGESPGKESVRGLVYGLVPRHPLFAKKHIVVAGSCGDIDMLLRWGVRPANIIACDKRSGCLAWANRHGTTIPPKGIRNSIVDTVAWAVQTYGESAIGSVNVDLCKTLKTTLPTLADVVDQLPVHSWLFYTFQCAHDPGLARRASEVSPGRRRIDYIRREITNLNHKLSTFYPYNSWTKGRRGTNMCVMVAPPS